MIFIYSCVYNSEKTLPAMIESVLRQSYGDFEFHIEDNGSADGTQEIVRDYASRDNRIILHIREKNHTLTGEPPPTHTFVPSGHGYFTNIDGDDWWELDYLERLLDFAEKYRLDIACTGTLMHDIATGGTGTRSIPRPLVLGKKQFAEGFPYYHAFFRPIWGKLIRTELIPQIHLPSTNSVFFYGSDTFYCFQALRHANRIGIDSSVLHHYRIAPKTLSGQYNVGRFEADVYLYDDAVDFLSAFGPISAQNRKFLQIVYANALFDTTGVIQKSVLSPVEKLKEYRTIAEHPLTVAAYRECKDASIDRSRQNLLVSTLAAGAALGKKEDTDFRSIMQTLRPRCGQAVFADNVQMFLEDAKIMRALLQDDPDTILQDLLERMEKNQGAKKYSVPKTIQSLAVNDPLLCQIDDAVFMRNYAPIYRLVWQGKTLDALEEMTGLLLEDRLSGGQETFLQLYISLSAVLEQGPAFVYGKLRLAQLYFRQKRLSECCAVVTELEEMGLTDNEELEALRHDLDRNGE